MKIVMLGQKGIPTLFGGIERHVEEISWRLAKKGHQVFVYARSYYTPKKVKKYRGVNIIHLPTIKTKHLDAISHVLFATLHAIFKVKPDVFHYHAIGPALCSWLPKVFAPKSKVIFTFHCQDYFHQKWGLFARLSLRLGEMIGCSMADEIIAVSPEIKRYVKRLYKRNASYIPHGVVQEKNNSAKLIQKWGLKKSAYILAVTRLIPHKGVHYLIEAFQQIKTEKKLVIVGPSFHTQNYENQLKELAKGNPNILFLGVQFGQVLKELFVNAYVYVHASEQEGLPLTVMEAAGFGKMLLLSNIQPHQEALADLPLFFKNKSVRDLKKKLEFLLKNPRLVSRRAKEIQKYSARTYSWDNGVGQLVARYA